MLTSGTFYKYPQTGFRNYIKPAKKQVYVNFSSNVTKLSNVSK